MPTSARYSDAPGADQPSKEVQRLVTALVTCRPAAVMTQCHLPTSARYSNIQQLISIIQEFVRRDKSVYPAALLSTLRRRPSSRRAPPTPQRSCKMSRSPPSSSLVASVCRLLCIAAQFCRTASDGIYLHEGPVYQLQSAVLTQRQSL